MRHVAFALAALLCAAGCASSTDANADDADVANQDLTGGSADTRWDASGYLVTSDEPSHAACGATLIAPKVVVTAAHCVTDTAKTFSFGTGDIGSRATTRVVERHAHPAFHAEAQGKLDVTHALRNFDIAYLVLEHAVAGIAPAALPAKEASMGLEIQAIGYTNQTRKSTPASVVVQVDLGKDPIFEVHPENKSGLCVADGDEGSAVVARDSGTTTTLIGIYVGSVTQALTDCKRGWQYLDGYESAYGYRDFLAEGIKRGSR